MLIRVASSYILVSIYLACHFTFNLNILELSSVTPAHKRMADAHDTVSAIKKEFVAIAFFKK